MDGNNYDPNDTAKAYDLVVGERGSGLKIHLKAPKTSQISQAQMSEEEIATYGNPVTLFNTGDFCTVSGSGDLTRFDSPNVLWAVDNSTGLVHTWERDLGDPALTTGQFDLEVPDGLEIIDSAFLHSTPSRKMVVAAVVSDGNHDGDHRIITATFDMDNPAGTIRNEFSWSKGTPKDIDFVRGGVRVILESAPFVGFVYPDEPYLEPKPNLGLLPEIPVYSDQDVTFVPGRFGMGRGQEGYYFINVPKDNTYIYVGN